MKLKICEYCGTEYNENLPQCPLCGRSDGAGEEAPRKSRSSGKRGGARVAPKGTRKAKKQRSDDRIPQWMWAVICVILALAVLIGLAYFLISMGYIGGKKAATDVPQTSVAVPEVDPVNEPELLEPMPEEILIPADLSCTELTLSQDVIAFDVEGSSVFLTAIPTPLETTDPVFYVSADETVAVVDENGMITAVGRGQTEITVVCGDISAVCRVICDIPEEEAQEDPQQDPDENAAEEDPAQDDETEPEQEEPEEIIPPSLSSEDFTLFRPGEETKLTVKDAPEGAYITYSSSDPDVATVSSTGLVKAVGNGTATITVMVGDVKLTCVARCNLGSTTENNEQEETTVSGTLGLVSAYGAASDITFSQSGETLTLRLVDSAGNKVSGAGWSSSNGGICTVDANGRITALSTGTATVTASYGGQSYSCIVRCSF